jgi:RHS repeat-associated protein
LNSVPQINFQFDHLGTITHVTDASGNVVNEYSFDAWGRRRNFTDWTYTVAAQTDILPDRGFTGHEYLPWFKLYNMNGRLYDPVVGRFLEPDPIVQNAFSTQNLNRYSYALNNPLRYVDPTGNKMLESRDKMFDYLMDTYDYEGGSFLYRGTNYSYNSDAGGFVGSNSFGGQNAIYQAKGYEQTTDYWTAYKGDDGKWVKTHYSHSKTEYWNEWELTGYIDPSRQGGRNDGNGYAEALYIANTINSLYEENATLNLKALKREAQELKNVRRKVPSHINKAMDANKFTKVITKSVGKKLYGVGLVFSAVDMYQDSSASNIAWNVADGIVGWAAFVPGLQIPALIYFTGRISYDIYDAYNEP